jgi:hypothetical protein
VSGWRLWLPLRIRWAPRWGVGKGDWSRHAIEKIAPDAMVIRARWYHWSNDPFMVALFTRNFANGWQFANGAGDAYKNPTIELEQESVR